MYSFSVTYGRIGGILDATYSISMSFTFKGILGSTTK